MAENTAIEWSDHTFNPWRGCRRVSEACRFCYAERQSKRNPKVLGVWGPEASGGTRVLASEAQWKKVEDWDKEAGIYVKPARVFCASIADVMEDWRGQLQDSQERPLWHFPDSPNDEHCPFNAGPGQNPGCVPYTMADARKRLFHLIRRTPNLRWLLLTKRPENFACFMPTGTWRNVWLGTTVESQGETPRIDELLAAPQKVPVRFLSCEPLLGPLSLWSVLPSIQWVIVGGESGSESREMRLGWVRSLIAQCRDGAVPIFVKQMGRVLTVPDAIGGRFRLPMEHDAGHGGDMRDWPEDICIREAPTL